MMMMIIIIKAPASNSEPYTGDCLRGDATMTTIKRQLLLVFVLLTEHLQVDVLKLQKENLILEQEKLQLQISLLKHRLGKPQ